MDTQQPVFSPWTFITERRDQIELIKRMVDMTERLHKHVQLSGTELSIPILNESRYLSRALVDLFDSLLFPPTEQTGCNSARAEDALSRAKVAASSALHDVVDQFMLSCAQAILAFEAELNHKDDGSSKHGTIVPHLNSSWTSIYAEFIHAYGRLEVKIAESRAQRAKREETYIEIIREMVEQQDSSSDLATVIAFYRKLPELELFLFSNESSSASPRRAE